MLRATDRDSSNARSRKGKGKEFVGGRKSLGPNFVLAQFVISAAVRDEDFFHLMERTPATMVLVICDADNSMAEADSLWSCLTVREYMLQLLEELGGLWGAEIVGLSALFYKVGHGRVTAVAVCDHGPLEDDDTSWMFSSFNVTLAGDVYTPSAVVAVACVSRKENGEAEPWGTAFFWQMKERIVGDKVRFLGGLMRGVPKEQVEDLGRSCGATSTHPVHQAWRRCVSSPYSDRLFLWVTHAAYIIPFGRCTKIFFQSQRPNIGLCRLGCRVPHVRLIVSRSHASAITHMTNQDLEFGVIRICPTSACSNRSQPILCIGSMVYISSYYGLGSIEKAEGERI